MGGFGDGFGLLKWIREHLGLDAGEIRDLLEQFEKALKMSAQLVAVFHPGTRWIVIAEKALELVAEAERFEELSNAEKREYVKDKLYELYPVPAMRILYGLLEDALTVRTAQDTAPLLRKQP